MSEERQENIISKCKENSKVDDPINGDDNVKEGNRGDEKTDESLLEKRVVVDQKEKKSPMENAENPAAPPAVVVVNKSKFVVSEILPICRPPGVSLASGEHPLHYSWSFWYLKGDRQKDWVDCLRKIADFDTVERFFALYNYIQPASTLSWGSDYYLFKTGIQPMWEDPHNIDGGRWVANIEKNKRQAKLDDAWLELLTSFTRTRRPSADPAFARNCQSPLET